MTWNQTGNIQGPPGIVPGISALEFGTMEASDPSGNFQIPHGQSTAPSVVIATVDTTIAGGSEGFHAGVGQFTSSQFQIHVNSDTGANVTTNVRVHWIAIWD